jgi:hypothetical protein
MASTLTVKARKAQQQKARQLNTVVSVPSVRLGMPATFMATLRYCEYAAPNPGAGAFSRTVYTCNNAYDPNYTGVGHQPLGFDQLAAMYSHYTVMHSVITATMNVVAADAPSVQGILVSDQNDHAGPWPVVCEQGYKQVTFQMVGPATSALNPLRIGWNLKENMNIKDPSNPSVCAPVSASPTDVQYYIVFIQAVDQSADLSGIAMVITVTYDVLFSTRKDLTGS